MSEKKGFLLFPEWEKNPPIWVKVGRWLVVPALLVLPHVDGWLSSLRSASLWVQCPAVAVLLWVLWVGRRVSFSRSIARKLAAIGRVESVPWRRRVRVHLRWRRPALKPHQVRLRKLFQRPLPIGGHVKYPREMVDVNPKLHGVVCDVLAGPMGDPVEISWPLASRRKVKKAPFLVVRWEDSPAWPYLDAPQTCLWEAIPMGLDLRRKPVSLTLPYRSVLVGGTPDSGKALALSTEVPTPTGWTTMGELKTGDLVFGADGQPCHVAHAFDVRYDRPCYEVIFSDHTTVIADADHLWKTSTRASRLSAYRVERRRPVRYPQFSHDQSHKRVRDEVVTTEQVLATLRVDKDRRANHAVDLAAPMDLPEADLPIDPYLLGIWLADGNSRASRITNPDQPIRDRIEASGHVTSTHAHPTCPGGTQTLLRAAGLLQNKHIPLIYQRASEKQRHDLLAGLLDGDGYASEIGNTEYTSTRERLARDVYELVCGLGIKATLRSKPAKLNGRVVGTCWVVAFTTAEPVFSLDRKACRLPDQTRKTQGRRYIVDVRPVPSVPVRCIAVDSPDHLYLVTRSFIPTHNSALQSQTLSMAALDPTVSMDCFDGTMVDMAFWRPIADNFVGPDIDGAIDVLNGIQKALDERLEWLLDHKLRKIGPDSPYGLHVIAFDELAYYFLVGNKAQTAAFSSALIDVAQRGRKGGMPLVAATQKPAGDCVPTLLRDNILFRVAMYCSTPDASDTVLGRGAAAMGYDAHELPLGKPGVAWLMAGKDPDDPKATSLFRQMRSYYLSDDDLDRIATRAIALRASYRAAKALVDRNGRPIPQTGSGQALPQPERVPRPAVVSPVLSPAVVTMVDASPGASPPEALDGPAA